jgi:3-oxoacyl-[acyl-carrier-protein] synthase-3
MAIEIIATGRAIPPKRVTNDDLTKTVDTTDEWIRSHTGILARHIAAEDIAVSDLALEAARNALAQAIERGAVRETTVEALAATVDMIVLATTTPDFYGCPSTACIVQDKLGARNAGAMDITVGCSGFVYGMETAAGVLLAGRDRKRSLVIGADVLSRFIDWTDRSTCVLFGDGAGAVLIEKTGDDPAGPGDSPHGAEKRGLLRTVLGSDGSGGDHLIIRKGGSRHPYHAGDIFSTPPYIEMNGRAVYTFAVKAMTDTVERLLAEEGLTLDQVKRIVPHQANARIIQAAAKRLGVPEEKFYLNIEEYANTSAASIPIALDELNREGQIQRGDLVMTLGFGAGLTYAGGLMVW